MTRRFLALLLVALALAVLPASAGLHVNNLTGFGVPKEEAASTDLLVCVFASGGSGTTTISFPGGWTAGTTETNTNISLNWGYKVGNDTGNITVTTADSKPGAYNCYRLSNYTGTPEATLGNSGGSTNSPNPPSLDPSWGAVDTLYIAGAGMQADGTVVDEFTVFSSGYSNGIQDALSSGDHAAVGTARKASSSTSDDPGALTFEGSKRDTTITIAVQGDSGTPTVTNTSIGATSATTSHTVTLPST